MTSPTILRAATGLLVVAFLLGLVVSIGPNHQPVHAHTQYENVSGSGRCPSDVIQCVETWTHVNNWTHNTATVDPGCTWEEVHMCTVTITSTSGTSSCGNSQNCGHGPHDSTPQPTGPGTWTVWNGHYNTGYEWSGRRPVDHDHSPDSNPCPPGFQEGNFGICYRYCPDGQTVITPGQSCPEDDASPAPGIPVPTTQPTTPPGSIWPGPIWPGRLPTPTPPLPTPSPTPEPKVCTSSWSSATRQELLGRVRWESIVPYPDDFTDYHHPEIPGGQKFLTTASTPHNTARLWVALQSGTGLNVADSPDNGCLWTATSVGVSLRELLPYEAADLARLNSPGNVAAADAAREAADLWDRLSPQRKQWFKNAFPRVDPETTWCPPGTLAPWTIPTDDVLRLPSSWEQDHGQCRWSIPRRGFWDWQIRVRYVSEEGDNHIEVLDSDLSWFREPAGYLGDRVTIW